MSYRHPESIQRPTFNGLHAMLNKPDNSILAWTVQDESLYSENARTIGAVYEDGETLFSDLQKTYITKP